MELLEQHTIKQKQITEAVLSAQEEERKIIGTELHDNINQILATSKLYYGAVDACGDNLTEMLAKGDEYITLAIEEIRKLSRKLVAPPFIESGLQPAITELAQNIMMTKQMVIETIMSDFDEHAVSKELKINIYRIVQEQLNNILKYAQADSVSVALCNHGNKIRLDIHDNGVGFDTSQKSKGIGLANIRTRAELFDGIMEIESSPGNGCRLKVILFNKNAKSQLAA